MAEHLEHLPETGTIVIAHPLDEALVRAGYLPYILDDRIEPGAVYVLDLDAVEWPYGRQESL